HQRGSGVFSSSMPSHSWPTVSVPVGSSILFLSAMIAVLENHVRRVAIAFPVAREKCPADEGEIENRHEQQAPAVGEMTKGVVAHRTCSCAAADLVSTSVPSI